MKQIDYTLRLVTDATPGTGFGSGLVDEYVTRNHKQQPVIRASHLKGLVRQFLYDLTLEGSWSVPDLDARFLGQADDETSTDSSIELRESRIHFSDAVMIPSQKTDAEGSPTRLLTRTAIDPETGTIKTGMLRTSESIAADTVFKGSLFVQEDEVTEDMAKLALLSLETIGSSRTRGAGKCVVDIPGEKRTPGTLLLVLHKRFKESPESFNAGQPFSVPKSNAAQSSDKHVILRLVFRAEDPVCCPERPVRTGVIKSSFDIPASAVQGMILTTLSNVDPQLASTCFESNSFRAWPLLPCEMDSSKEDLPIPTRISLTHRVAKIIDPVNVQESFFQDEAIEEYNYEDLPYGSPLKATDGVLLSSGGNVSLWKSAMMPRLVSAHGVHNDPQTEDGRNLYTVEAMAPMVWSGYVSMPEEAASTFLDQLQKNPHTSFGRGRSVRGRGRLEAIKEDLPKAGASSGDILIAQSPLLLEETSFELAAGGESLTACFKKELVPWAEKLELPAIKECWCVFDIRFGWNRAGLGEKTGKGNRLRACPVVAPGAVIKFESSIPAEKVSDLLVKGFGRGRERGYGALALHPGIGRSLHPVNIPEPSRGTPERERKIVRKILEWTQGKRALPSASQVRAVQQRLAHSGVEVAKAYLAHQKERTPKIWSEWEGIHGEVVNLFNEYDREQELLDKALTLLANQIAARTG